MKIVDQKSTKLGEVLGLFWRWSEQCCEACASVNGWSASGLTHHQHHEGMLWSKTLEFWLLEILSLSLELPQLLPRSH